MLQDFLIQSENQLPAAFLLFIRMSGLLVTAPVFGHRSVPVPVKAALSLILTLLLTAALPLQPLPPLTGDGGSLAYLIKMLMEISVGLILGFTIQLFFSVTQIAGQIIDVSMGLGIGSVLDPQNNMQSPVSGVLLNLGLMLYFLVNNGHLHLLRIVAASVRYAPVGHVRLPSELAILMTSQFTSAFSLAVSLSLPLIGTALMIEVALGILMRAVPQISAYMVGIPLKILLGLTALFLTQPFFGPFCDRIFEQAFQASESMVHLMGGAA